MYLREVQLENFKSFGKRVLFFLDLLPLQVPTVLENPTYQMRFYSFWAQKGRAPNRFNI